MLLNLSLSQGFEYGKTVLSIGLEILFVPILQAERTMYPVFASVTMTASISQCLYWD